MGGLWGNLANIGEDMLTQHSPLANSIISRYKRSDDQPAPGGMQGPPPINPDGSTQADNPGMSALQGANSASGMKDLAAPGSGQQDSISQTIPDAASMASMSPWNQPQQSSGGGILPSAISLLAAKDGAIVTQPTIARIGERGPEAIVPLKGGPGAKMTPDIMEGRISAPRVPGVKYSRYKGFNRFGPGAGGQV